MIESFNKNGHLIIKEFFKLDQLMPLKRSIGEIIRLVAQIHNVNLSTLSDDQLFDKGIALLAKKNRKFVGHIYDGIKGLPEFQRLISHTKFTELFKVLRPNSLPGFAVGGSGIRIDLPNEDKYRARWHQEYLSQLRSLDGLIFWTPLVDITFDMGPVRILSGSHIEGVLKVEYADPSNENAYSLRLVNEDRLLKLYKCEQPLVNVGDLIILDYLTIHSSGVNISDKARWSLQARYFNYLNVVGQSYLWSGSYADGIDFREIHPNLFHGDSR
jgi:hypothetical protein